MTTTSIRRRATSASWPRRCAANFRNMPAIFRSRAFPSASRSFRATTPWSAAFEGADGMKTGYTCPSGYNLVASATRNGRTLMAVVIGATSVKARNKAAAAMLERGFSAPANSALMLAALQPSGSGSLRPPTCAPIFARRPAASRFGRRSGSLRPRTRKKARPRRKLPISPSARGRGSLSRSASAVRPARLPRRSAAAFAEEAAIAAQAAELIRAESRPCPGKRRRHQGGRLAVAGKDAVACRRRWRRAAADMAAGSAAAAGTEPLMTQGDSAAVR